MGLQASLLSLLADSAPHILSVETRAMDSKTLSASAPSLSIGPTAPLSFSLAGSIPTCSAVEFLPDTCPASQPSDASKSYPDAVRYITDTLKRIGAPENENVQTHVGEMCGVVAEFCQTLKEEKLTDSDGEFSSEGWYVRFCRGCVQVAPLLASAAAGVFLVIQLEKSNPNRVREEITSRLDSEIREWLKNSTYKEMEMDFYHVAKEVAKRHGYEMIEEGNNEKTGPWMIVRKGSEQPIFLCRPIFDTISEAKEEKVEGDEHSA